MKTNATRRAITAAVVVSAVLFSGCLTKEESEPGTGDSGDQVQNSPPIISGSPASAVTIGKIYSLTPTASDPDGDALSFSALNVPSWANFDSTTGTLSGTPTLAHVGTYGNIQISVSDGLLSASLPQFSVDVVQAALGSVTLSWTPPTQNEDGSSLADLAGYRFYYGTVSGTYPNSVRVDTAGIASYVIENLVPDTYYFVATAINGSGVESGFSNEAIKQVL